MAIGGRVRHDDVDRGIHRSLVASPRWECNLVAAGAIGTAGCLERRGPGHAQALQSGVEQLRPQIPCSQAGRPESRPNTRWVVPEGLTKWSRDALVDS